MEDADDVRAMVGGALAGEPDGVPDDDAPRSSSGRLRSRRDDGEGAVGAPAVGVSGCPN